MTYSLNKIPNPIAYKVLLALGMFYMSAMLLTASLTNRYVGTDKFFLLGGVLIIPFIFILDDIIAEIYGYKITKSIILTGFVAQTLFALVCQLVIMAPAPHIFKENAAYSYVLGPGFLRNDISDFIAYIVANLMNTYILTRWKVLLKGKHFWMRSLGSSVFSEALYSFLAIMMMEIGRIPLNNILRIALISWAIKAGYSIVFAGPAQLLVNYLKRITGIDVYDFPKEFTPLKYKTSCP